MLYDFHRNENAKKPGSVNATYVIAGTQKPPEPPLPANNSQGRDGGDDDDEAMQSSPYLSSSMPNQDVAVEFAAIASIMLVREEDFEGRRECVSGIGLALTGYSGEIDLSIYLLNACV